MRNKIPQDSLWEQPLRALRQNSSTCPDSSRAQSEEQFQNRFPLCSTVAYFWSICCCQRLQFSWRASTFAELWPQQEKQCWQGPLPLHPPSDSSYWAPPPIQPLPRAVIFGGSDILCFHQISIEQIHSCLEKLTASISMHVFQPGVWFTPALLQKIFTWNVF